MDSHVTWLDRDDGHIDISSLLAGKFEDFKSTFCMPSDLSSARRYFLKDIPVFVSGELYSQFHRWFCVQNMLNGIFVPQYETIERNELLGSWWPDLGSVVHQQQSQMSQIVLLALNKAFANATSESDIVWSLNDGYVALFNLAQREHPKLVDRVELQYKFPCQRSNESFHSFTAHCNDWLLKEHVRGCVYGHREFLYKFATYIRHEHKMDIR